MAELATKTDLLAVKQELQTEFRGTIAELRGELHSSVAELRGSIAELRSELHSNVAELRSSIAELRSSIAELRSKMDTQSLQLTVRLGALMVVALGALATIMKLLQ